MGTSNFYCIMTLTKHHGNIGMGEAVVLGASAAIGNAIYNAIGVRIKELPITGEKILKALEEEKGVG